MVNEVDRLKARIKEMQDNCYHNFRLKEKPKLRKTLVRGVFVGSVKHSNSTPITLICIKCSKEKETDISETCPKCLSPMEKKISLGGESRKEYFGEQYLYFAIELSRCTKCNFTIASDEWCQ